VFNNFTVLGEESNRGKRKTKEALFIATTKKEIMNRRHEIGNIDTGYKFFLNSISST
jgi:hypothetical protein